MKYKMTIFLALFLSLQGMDAPLAETETVPVKMQDLHNKEQRKFKKYDLNHPEKFLQLMREKFNYEQNKEEYLKQVQTFGSGLLAQHLAMHYFGENAYFLSYYYQLKDKYNMLIKKLGASISPQGLIESSPDTAEQLNIILANNDLLRQQTPLSPDQISIFFAWILDREKGVWLNNLGLLQKIKHEMNQEVSNANAIRYKAEFSLAPSSGTPFETKKPLANENFMYALEILNNAHRARSEANEKANQTFDQIAVAITQLYRIHQKEYQRLYDIVKKELFTQYREAVSAGQKIPATILLPIPEELRKQNHIPSKFPDQLETIKNPAIYLPHASLDAELEKARIEWEKSHQEPAKQKKKWRRPKKQFSLGLAAIEEPSAEITTTLSEIEPKKIRIGTDKSFIAEGGEDDLQIIIEDPAHESAAIIFKTKNSPANSAQLKALPKMNYTPWVNEWFENPEKAILTHGYKDPKNPRYRAGQPYWKPIVLHAFPKLVDEYIYQYGSVSQTPSRMVKDKNDIMITIPGKMEYPDGNEETGVFTYIIDPANGQWFHRMFTPSSHKKMAEDFMEKGYFAPEVKGYYDVYFPPLPSK